MVEQPISGEPGQLGEFIESSIRELLGDGAATRPDVFDIDLFDLGFDSITFLKLRSRILDSFRVDVSPDDLFMAPTLRDVAALIVANEGTAATDAPTIPESLAT